MSRCRQRQAQLLPLVVAITTVTANSSPTAAPLVSTIRPSGGIGLCQGGCQNHDDCQSGLVCYKRNGNDPAIDLGSDFNFVPGCASSTSRSDGDDAAAAAAAASEINMPLHVNYCISPAQNFTKLTYIGQRGPLGTCAGDCDTDSDCIDGLLCYQRKDRPYDIPYKCQGTPWGSVDYCVEPPPDDEYVPGFLTSTKYGVHLSNGLDIRPIARSGHPVVYADGTSSELPFHHLPDYGACFEDTTGRNPGGWAYVSNSEVKHGGGGVGVVLFNADGQAISYDMLLRNTSRNCGGGVTSWNTFISCEESGNTHCHELDPFAGGLVDKEESRTVLGAGNFESFAYDERDSKNPSYFVTEDRKVGPLRRYRPAAANGAESSYQKMLFGNGTIDYLVLEPTDDEARRQGTFFWTTDKEEADSSAHLYSNAEGIDVKDGIMHFTARRNVDIFILDLDNANYTRISPKEEGMDLSADQLIRLSGDNSGIIYMTNHGWKASAGGVYSRDAHGLYKTILESTLDEDGYRMDRLTTGLAFNRGGKYMYVCWQRAGACFSVWRKDGRSFDGAPTHTVRYFR